MQRLGDLNTGERVIRSLLGNRERGRGREGRQREGKRGMEIRDKRNKASAN